MAATEAWDELSDDLRQAFGWAHASESWEVGTRALLIGMIRTGEGTSEPEQLLRAVGRGRDDLFEALRRTALPAIEVDVDAPSQLKALPPVTSNVVLALDRARELRPPKDFQRPLEPRHLFAAILELPGSTAYRGLEAVLDGRMSMQRVRELVVDHLHRTDGRSFADLLHDELAVDPRTRQQIFLPDSFGAVTLIALSPDGSTLAVATAIGLVHLRDLDRDHSLGAISVSKHDLLGLAFSHDGRQLVAMAGDGTVSLWDIQQLGVMLALHYPRAPMSCLALSSDARRVAGVGRDRVVRVLDLEPTENIKSVERPLGDAGAVLATAFADDGARVVSVDERGVVESWAVAGVAVTRVLEVGRDVSAAAFSTDGRWLAVAYRAGAVQLWDLASDTAGAAYDDGSGPATDVALSADGRWLASLGEGGGVRVRAVPLPARKDDPVEWVPDAPAQVDLLGHEQLGVALAQRLQRMAKDHRKDAFLLHIDGPWGSGKSSVLGFLRRQLGRDSLIVDFDAWRQSRIGPPWWALLTSLRKAMWDDLGLLARWRLRVAEAWERLRRDRISLPPFVLVAVLVLVVLGVTRPASSEVQRAAELLSLAVGGFTMLWAVGRVVASFLMWESATGARRYEQSHQSPMESLAVHFAWLVSRAGGHVVFFIEDLDRCNEEYVVDLLDSIQTLVRDTPGRASRGREPHFVVVADGRWIRRSYEEVYHCFQTAVSEPGRPLGYLFLDKIFQLTVQVPQIGPLRQSAFLKSLLGQSSGSQDVAAELAERTRRIKLSTSQDEILSIVDEASPAARLGLTEATLERLRTPELERSAEHELQKFAALLERNPRSMKRFLNAYSMALSGLLLEGRRVEPDPLALWTILRLRWPDLADHLRAHPEDVGTLASADVGPGGLTDDLIPLSRSPDVRAVACFGGDGGGGLLTTGVIRVLSGSDREDFPAR